MTRANPPRRVSTGRCFVGPTEPRRKTWPPSKSSRSRSTQPSRRDRLVQRSRSSRRDEQVMGDDLRTPAPASASNERDELVLRVGATGDQGLQPGIDGRPRRRRDVACPRSGPRRGARGSSRRRATCPASSRRSRPSPGPGEPRAGRPSRRENRPRVMIWTADAALKQQPDGLVRLGPTSRSKGRGSLEGLSTTWRGACRRRRVASARCSGVNGSNSTRPSPGIARRSPDVAERAAVGATGRQVQPYTPADCRRRAEHRPPPSHCTNRGDAPPSRTAGLRELPPTSRWSPSSRLPSRRGPPFTPA